MTQGEAPLKPSAATEEPKSLKLKTRIKNWFTDTAIFLICGLPVAILFEHFLGKEALNDILTFQTRLYNAVSTLSPLRIFGYVDDSHSFLFFQLDTLLSYILPIVLVNKIMYAFWFLLWIVVVSLSPVVLPITVLMEGTPLEWILVFVVFIPLAGLVIAASKDDDSGYFIFWGMLVALGVTTLFFWFVQLAMLGALFAFGKIVNTAATWTASSIFASGAYWCVAKSAEHSLTERVLHFGRTALAACVRGLLSRFG